MMVKRSPQVFVGGCGASGRAVRPGGEASPVEMFEQPNWGLKSFGKARITIMGIERA
jgi:hypothetical protein